MRDAEHIKPVQLADYLAPAYLLDHTSLDVTLDATRTQVASQLQFKRNPARADSPSELWLDGEQLELVSIALNGKDVPASQYQLSDKGMLLRNLPEQFELAITVIINPQANTALEGLYMSHGMYCTQCEAQGFRRITFYPDRPDVLSKFTTTVRGNKNDYPLLLSNGNPIAQGEEGNTHWVTWEDPFLKPSYLFALVAGDLACLEDSFTTMSGRNVTLKIFAEQRDLDKLDHAMTSLKNAMRWDEQTFGREYDLDLFMIVAVSHFNMGAMENKGLNVFNTSCVLAHPNTTTDAGFQRVESVVAHEYFHNWSGNRVTCRDWFQLSLKEGFTVYREHEFASDMNSRTVKRVEDVSLLRSHQFPEDQGPMAHPVRPASYQKIDNFYTLTIYEKGAEVVRMQAEMLGREAFRQATDDYFARFDGQAVTCDDFVACMERAGKLDLTQFKRWYSQAGTPRISASGSYANGTFTLTLEQHNPATPGQSNKLPQVIPIKMALVGQNGLLPLDAQGNTETVLILNEAEQQFSFNVSEQPVPSLLRGFSAPVELKYAYSEADLARLLTQDNDGFCRWDAAQRLYIAAIERLIENPELIDSETQKLTAIFEQLINQKGSDPAELALLLTLPSDTLIGDRQAVWYPERIHAASQALLIALAKQLENSLWQLVEQNATPGAYQPVAADIGKRSLRWGALNYLAALQTDKVANYLAQAFEQADNMTDELNALRLLVHNQLPQATGALATFEQRWKDESLVMDKWFGIQASVPTANTLEAAKALLAHPQFDLKLPNRVRALLSSFAANPVAFHQASGAGYDFYFEQIAALDKVNPQVAARMATVASRLSKLPTERQRHLRTRLQQIVANGASDNLTEVLNRILG